ncbi:MAG TPA: hypothetical protein VGA89_02760 [Patescibacteria group bacterium]|jgi:ABC-type nitrate/sulfonate/bicarbonate transport system permease component
MKKNFVLILILSLFLLLVVWWFAIRYDWFPKVEPTPSAVRQEVETTATPESAGELVIEKIDEELDASSDTDFNPDDLSDESLGL